MKILGAAVEEISWIRVGDDWIYVADIWPPDAEGIVRFRARGHAFQHVRVKDIVMVQTKGEVA